MRTTAFYPPLPHVNISIISCFTLAEMATDKATVKEMLANNISPILILISVSLALQCHGAQFAHIQHFQKVSRALLLELPDRNSCDQRHPLTIASLNTFRPI